MIFAKKLKTTCGDRCILGDSIASRGQGDAYMAVLESTKQKGVVKLFKKRFHTDSTRRRIRYIVEQNINAKCALIAAPTHVIDSNGDVGHFAPHVGGQSLDRILQEGNINLWQTVRLSNDLAEATFVLHENGIAHGDLHSENVIVDVNGEQKLICHLIDLDNFHASGQPLPDMIGQHLYLSPEQRSAISAGRPAIPNEYTDRFALAILIHEILLLKHPATGSDQSPEQFNEAMCKGRWQHDPANDGDRYTKLGGYPPGILGPSLSSLFRRALKLQPETRPTPLEWKHVLEEALSNIHSCSQCNGSFIIDPYAISCPHCKQLFRTLVLKTPNSKEIILDRAAVSVGREILEGDSTVSAQHAIFRKRGAITCLESRGLNGTHRFDGHTWVRIPDGVQITVKAGDRFRFGDLELHLQELM